MSDRRMSVLHKIMDKVEVQTDPSMFWHGTPCWLWTGGTSGNGRGGGYPRMTQNGATVAVHLVMFTHVYGYIPWNKTIDHECKRRLCLNPAHLSMVSMKENYRRRDGKDPRSGTDHNTPIPPRYLPDFLPYLAPELRFYGVFKHDISAALERKLDAAE